MFPSTLFSKIVVTHLTVNNGQRRWVILRKYTLLCYGN